MNVKDLINAGLFTVLIGLAAMITPFVGLLPFLMPFIPVFFGLVTGPIYMLYATKIKSPECSLSVSFSAAACLA